VSSDVGEEFEQSALERRMRPRHLLREVACELGGCRWHMCVRWENGEPRDQHDIGVVRRRFTEENGFDQSARISLAAFALLQSEEVAGIGIAR
jgi:hypothetical protein